MDPHTISARYYAQITDTTYRPTYLRRRPASTYARVFRAGLIGLAGLVAVIIMLGALS